MPGVALGVERQRRGRRRRMVRRAADTAFLTLYRRRPAPLPGLSAGSDDVALGVHPDGWAVGTSADDFCPGP